MKIAAIYSHLNGLEYLKVHRPKLWGEVRFAIKRVDAEACKTKVSEEKKMKGKMLYSPPAMNDALKAELGALKWRQRQNTFWATDNEKLLRGIYGQKADDQKAAILASGKKPIRSYNQTDFVKERVAIEVQFGKYALVAHDLFVKHLSFFVSHSSFRT